MRTLVLFLIVLLSSVPASTLVASFATASVTGSVSLKTEVSPAPIQAALFTEPTDSQQLEYARQAGSAALESWVAEFLRPELPAKRFAVLPLRRDLDGDYLTLQLRNVLAGRVASTGGSVCTRDDETWKSLLAELRRSDQMGDTMDAATLQKLGRIEGVQCIVLGRVTGIHAVSEKIGGDAIQLTGERRAVQVRVLLQAYEVETGRLLWGAEKSGMALLPDDALVLPGTRRQWMVYGTIGLLAVVLLSGLSLLIFMCFKRLHRPR